MTKFTWLLYTLSYSAFILSLWILPLIMPNEFINMHYELNIICASVLYILLVILTIVIVRNSKKKFFGLLAKNKFIIDYQYQYENTIICIDVTNNKFACTELSLQPIKDFKNIDSCEIELHENPLWKTKTVNLIIKVQIENSQCKPFAIFWNERINKRFNDIDDYILNSQDNKKQIIINMIFLKNNIDKIIAS